MRKMRSAAGVVIALVAMCGLATGASASEWERFQNCPSTDVTTFKCIYSTTEGGEVVLGKKTVPIVNPAVLQGGFTKPVEKISKFVAATNGETLSKSPQPVPGGLAGLVNCKEISNFILRAACEWTFENGLTGVNSTLELARPASEVEISEGNLISKKGIALKLPVKIKLENPFLGSNCYVGSSSNPIIWPMITGTTAPPPPNTPITGASGTPSFLEEGKILVLSPTKLVENAWSAPS
ncbi:MAG TPA: hypothetical protein VFO36_08850, partial [Nitrospiraceae bacterium]|nr:hypothetical protein [Nitrospiraceae bacterium]